MTWITLIYFLILIVSGQLGCVRKTQSIGHENLLLSRAPQKNKNIDSSLAKVAPKSGGLSNSIGQALKASWAKHPRNNLIAINAGLLEEQDKAVSSLLKLSLKEPERADSHYRLAKLYHHLQVYDKAYSAYQKAIQLEPDNPAYYEAMGRLWRDWGTPHLGIKNLKKALQLNPHSVDTWNSLGTIHDLLRESSKAQFAYSRALAIKSDADFVHNNLCYSYLQSGQIKSAILHCQEAIRINPDLKIAYNNLGLALSLMGDFKQAMVHFQTATDQSTAHNNLGVMLLRAKRYRKAMEQFKVATRLRPFYHRARKNFYLARRLHNESDQKIRRQILSVWLDSDHSQRDNFLAGPLQSLKQLKTVDLPASFFAPLAVSGPD